MTALIVIATGLACAAVAQLALLGALWWTTRRRLRKQAKFAQKIIASCAEEFESQQKFNRLVTSALDAHARALKLKSEFFGDDKPEEE